MLTVAAGAADAFAPLKSALGGTLEAIRLVQVRAFASHSVVPARPILFHRHTETVPRSGKDSMIARSGLKQPWLTCSRSTWLAIMLWWRRQSPSAGWSPTRLSVFSLANLNLSTRALAPIKEAAEKSRGRSRLKKLALSSNDEKVIADLDKQISDALAEFNVSRARRTRNPNPS